MIQRNYNTMPIRVRALMVAAGALKDRFVKGDVQPNGLNASYIANIQSFSSQLYEDFKDLKEDFDAGKINLEFYIKQMNILFALVNSNITTDEDRLGVEEIRAEYARLKKRIDPPKPIIPSAPALQNVVKSTVSNALSSSELDKREKAWQKTLADLEAMAKSLQPLKKLN